MAGMGCFKGRNSDSAAMASGPSDVMANQEPAEVGEECSGKKKSKFQTFKKFFTKKKRKEPSSSGADAGLKASQSSDNVSKTSQNNTLTRSEKEKGSGSKISLGSKALSHDSVFVSDSSEANEALGASQDSIHGKVKSLQHQLRQAIRLGSPPSLMCVKRSEDAGTMSEDDGLPCSPPEYTALHTVQKQAQRNSSISLEATDSDEDQSCAASNRTVSPLVVVPGDFSQPASPFGCLDNSAAKHKLGLRHKACNKRKPANRLEIKAERDSVVKEILNTSFPDSSEEQGEQKTRDASGDELKLKVERGGEEEGEEEEEKEEEEKEQPQHSRDSLLRDKEEWEEGEDESEAEQDVPRSLDASSPPEPCLSEEEVADAQPTSKPGSRSSSLDSPRATPEPPAGETEYLLDTPSIAYETEVNRDDCNITLGRGGEEVQETREEENSFLQEVLSSLKTPLASCSLGMETDAVLEIEEEEEKEEEEAEVEEGEEVKEEDAEEEESVSYQAAPSGLLLLGQSAEEEEEEEEEAATPWSVNTSCQDVKEEDKHKDRVEAEEEELEVEQFSQHSQQEEEEREREETEEVKPEGEDNLLPRKTDQQTDEEEEEDQSEGEEEAIELEKEFEVEEEGQEKREEDDEEVKKWKERVEEAEEAKEEEEMEEMAEMFPDEAGREVHSVTPSQEVDEGVDVAVGDDDDDGGDDDDGDDDDKIPADLGGQESATAHESQAASNQTSEDEMSDEEKRAEEGVAMEHMEEKSDPEEDMEANRAGADDTEPSLEQECVEVLDSKHVETDQTEVNQAAAEQVSSRPSSLFLQESHNESQSEDSKTSPNTATTTIHINLVSPSSEKVAFSFQQSPTAADPKVAETSSHAGTATEQMTASTDEASADKVEEEEEDEEGKQSSEDATPPASVEETVNQSSSSSDQSKVRFTVNPTWQRSLSNQDAKDRVTSPSSPPVCVSSSSSAVTGPTAKKDPQVEAEPASPAKVESALSSGRARNAGSTAAKPQGDASQAPVKAPASAAAATEESPVVVEGNPDNPFGVRLRKTVALHRFSSEEEHTEPPVEPPVQPTSCKVESPQPISVKPSINQPVINKPALPKKPEVHGDSGVKTKRISDSAAVRGVSGGSDSPSWISVAKQKQKIYKETPLNEITVKKEEQERKSSPLMYVSSAASREQSNKTPESSSKVSPLDISKPSVSVEKETKRALSPPTPVPAQPPKSQALPCPVAPKPQLPPAAAKHPPQPTPAQRSLSPPTPVPVPLKPPSCTSSTSLSKTATPSKTPQAQSTTLTSAPFSSRTTPPQSGSRAPAISGQTPSTQRGLPPPDSPQDEPPWMALAKKKAKAWSEMPQIVQ